MSNKVKVFYPSNPPAVSIDCPQFPPLHVTRNCPFPGIFVEIIDLLTRDSNLTIVPYTAEDFGLTFDDLKDISSVGLFDLVKNGTIDLIAMSFQITEEREQNFSFSETVYQVQSRIMKRPSTKRFSKIWAFFENYDYYTWFAFLFIWILSMAMGTLVHKIEAIVHKRKSPPILESTWKIIRLLLRQPESLDCCSLGGKLSVFVFAFIQCTILLGLYSSLILANMIKSNDINVESVNTVLEQLNRKETYMVTDAPKKWIFEVINNSLAFPYPEFKSAFLKNPLKITKSVDETLYEVQQMGAMVFVQDDDKVNFYSRSQCDLEAAREGMPMASVNLMLQKASLLLPILNRAIERNQLQLARISSKYSELLRMKRMCDENKYYQALTFGPYVGLFILCSGIILLSVIIFSIENFLGYLFKRNSIVIII